MKIGIISDTHGLLRAQVFDVFQGVEHILHAGDVGDPDILTELAAIAPVTAVWGNVDGMDLRARIPEIARLELGGVRIVILHGMQLGSPTPQKAAAAHPDAGLVGEQADQSDVQVVHDQASRCASCTVQRRTVAQSGQQTPCSAL